MIDAEILVGNGILRDGANLRFAKHVSRGRNRRAPDVSGLLGGKSRDKCKRVREISSAEQRVTLASASKRERANPDPAIVDRWTPGRELVRLTTRTLVIRAGRVKQFDAESGCG